MQRVRSLQTTRPTQSRHIASIQVCRGLATILVVLGHLHGIELKYCTTDLMRLFDHGALGVDLFFVISGFVIAAVTTGQFASPRNAGVFLYHRVTRIYPILWIFTTIALVAYYLLPRLSQSGWNHPVSIVSSYTLIPFQRPMLLLQAWTLSYELYFYLVVFFLMLLTPERIARRLLLLWGIAIIALKLHIGLSPSAVIQLLISPTALEFIAGGVLFQFYRQHRLPRAVGPILLFASGIWLAAIIVYSDHAYAGRAVWITDAPWPRPILYGTFSALFLLGAVELERHNLIHFPHALEALGDWTYSIYLAHLFVLELIGRLAFRFFHFRDSILLIDLISLPSVIFVGYLSYRWLENPLKIYLYKLGPQPGKPAATTV
jgi:exopolysaccharide production protein ExoZ